MTSHESVGSSRVRVGLVFGGRSTEHSVSVVSAASVLAVLDPERYDVVALGITQDGRWVLAPDQPAALAATADGLPVLANDLAPLVLAGDPTVQGLVPLGAGAVDRIAGLDVVFPLLHGPYGEDGTLQGLLELAGLPYVGSGVFASAAAMDKQQMKLVLLGHGLPVGPYEVVTPRQWEKDPREVLLRLQERLTLPLFVKPARGGSSIGITKVTDAADLVEAIELARRADPKVVVEAMLSGREIECGVLEGPDGPVASLPSEIHVHGTHAFYDFEAKYLDEGTSFDIPAHLTPDETAAVQAMACAAFEALGCEGLARVDFFLGPDGLVVNEVNTMPGFTPASMFPRMWAASGVDYPTLVDRLLTSALTRRRGLR
ncbi:D-alanine--D-alanine ligase family protein [Acidothermaceae bacterium B102]|nr:D-alanine--D-alanine ligase family protein [Acidothermaceae bacterium B102]